MFGTRGHKFGTQGPQRAAAAADWQQLIISSGVHQL